MKRLLIVPLLLIVVCFQPQAHAESDLYYGGKLGFMMFDLEGYDDPLNAGALVGYTVWRGISVEGEMTTSLSDGKVDVLGTGFDVAVQTFGMFAAYRSGEETYFKAKFGYVNEDIETNGVGVDDTDTSFGIGYGWKTSSGPSFEVEYTVVSSDVNYLSFGLLF